VVTTVAKDFLGHSITSTGARTIRQRPFGNVGGGQTTSQGFIGTLLTPSCIELLLVGHGWVSRVAPTWFVSVVIIIRFTSVVSVVSRHVHDGFWNAHVVQTVLVGDRGVVEPRTFASLPRAGAEHAEVRATAAGHMITTLLKLDHSLAVEAALPTLLFGQIDKSLGLWIFGALAAGVHLVVAQRAHLCLAPRTATVLAALELVHIGRLDPLAAALRWTVEAVLCRVLLVLCVPQDLELVVEEVVDVFEGDVVLVAAFGGHVLRILDGHGEDAAET
jgi:hypothetical protein